MAKLIVLPRAAADLHAIWDYIAGDSPTAADRVLSAIDTAMAGLRDFPEMGSPRPDIRPSLRVLVHRPYLIAYRFDPTRDAVEIVRVIHGARDLTRLF